MIIDQLERRILEGKVPSLVHNDISIEWLHLPDYSDACVTFKGPLGVLVYRDIKAHRTISREEAIRRLSIDKLRSDHDVP